MKKIIIFFVLAFFTLSLCTQAPPPCSSSRCPLGNPMNVCVAYCSDFIEGCQASQRYILTNGISCDSKGSFGCDCKIIETKVSSSTSSSIISSMDSYCKTQCPTYVPPRVLPKVNFGPIPKIE